MSHVNPILNLKSWHAATLIVCILLSPFLLSGCISRPTAAQPTATKLNANQSILIGHKISVPYYSDIYVYATDKDAFSSEQPHHFKRPTILEAGINQLRIWCQHGAYQASNLVTFTAEKQKLYQVGIHYQAQPDPKCYMWIFDTESLDIVSPVVTGQALAHEKRRL